jgi:hypothetical protein
LPKQDRYRYRGTVLFHRGGGRPQDLREAGTRPLHVDVSIRLKQDGYRYKGTVLFHHGGDPPPDLWEAGTRPLHVDFSICLDRKVTDIEVLSSFTMDLWEAGTRPLHVDVSIRLKQDRYRYRGTVL